MTTSIVLLSSVIGCSLVWAVIATIIAYNRGREIDDMAERHNSIVEQLKETMNELEETMNELALSNNLIDHVTDDNEQIQALYNEASNKLKKFDRPRDPKTGRIVSKEQAMANAFSTVGNALSNCMDAIKEASESSNDTSEDVKKLCDEVKANAVNDVSAKNIPNKV